MEKGELGSQREPARGQAATILLPAVPFCTPHPTPGGHTERGPVRAPREALVWPEVPSLVWNGPSQGPWVLT